MRFRGVGTAAALALAACGGGGSPARCPVSQPCGGDLIGSWKVARTCVVPDAVTAAIRRELACPDLSVLQTSEGQTGTVTFGADSTYAGDYSYADSSVTAAIPLSCFAASGCEDVRRALLSHYLTVACSGTSTCNCTFPWLVPSLSGFGTYATSGTALTLNPDFTFFTRQYCVEGSTLHLFAAATPDTAIFDEASLVAQ